MDPGPRASAKEQPGRPPRVRPAGPRRGSTSVVVVVAVVLPADALDLPDHAGLGNLDKRRIGRGDELAPRIRLAEVPHRAVVDQVQRAVGAKLNLDGPVDAVDDARCGRLRERLIQRSIFSRRLVLAGRGAVRIHALVLARAVEREPGQLQLERLAPLAEVHQLDVVPCLRLAVSGREAEVALAGDQRCAPADDTGGEGVGGEVRTDRRDVSRLQGERRDRWLRREREHVLDRAVLSLDDRLACRERGGGPRGSLGWVAKIVAWPALRVEDGLGRIEEAEPVRPAMEVRLAILHLRQLQPVRRVVGRARATLILAVLGHEEPTLEGVVLGSKAQPEGIAVAPGEGLDALVADLRPQDRARAHAVCRGALERAHPRALPLDAMIREAARHVPIARVEDVVAQRDLLAGDVVLVAASAVVVAGHPRVGRRALRPVEETVLDDEQLGRVGAGRQAVDEPIHRGGRQVPSRIDRDDARGVVPPAARRAAHPLIRIGAEQGAAAESILEGKTDRRAILLEAGAGGATELAEGPRYLVAFLVEHEQVGCERIGWRGGAADRGLVVAVAVSRFVGPGGQALAGLDHEDLEVLAIATEGDAGGKVEVLGEDRDLEVVRDGDVLAMPWIEEDAFGRAVWVAPLLRGCHSRCQSEGEDGDCEPRRAAL